MEPTRVDPVDYARMIVCNYLASEFCKTNDTGVKSDVSVISDDFDRGSLQTGALIGHQSRSFDDQQSNAHEQWIPQDVAVLIFCILSYVIVVWYVAAQ